MSLRFRLTILLSVLFVFSMLLGTFFQISTARQRVVNEVEPTATLIFELLHTLLPLPSAQSAALDELLSTLQTMDNARHLDITLIDGGEEREEMEEREGEEDESESNGQTEASNEIGAPSWFVRLVEPEPLQLMQALTEDGSKQLLISTNPADEIEEVWEDSKRFLLVLMSVLVGINAALLIVVRHWFAPVTQIMKGIEEVGQGNFSARISEASLPELKGIAQKLNALNEIMSHSKQENDRLNKQSLSIKEEERQHLAQELHDEMGQSISAIKAIAFSISERLKELDKESANGAKDIGDIANHVRDHIKSIMSRLRPAALDEFGLIPALQQMVDEWNRHHIDCFCSLYLCDALADIDDDKHIHLYRIVQEALTNVAQHARADTAQVSIRKDESFHLTIEDNGSGFDREAISGGMGLRGIQDRALALGGHCEILSSPEQGCKISIRF